MQLALEPDDEQLLATATDLLNQRAYEESLRLLTARTGQGITPDTQRGLTLLAEIAGLLTDIGSEGRNESRLECATGNVRHALRHDCRIRGASTAPPAVHAQCHFQLHLLHPPRNEDQKRRSCHQADSPAQTRRARELGDPPFGPHCSLPHNLPAGRRRVTSDNVADS